MEDGFVAALPLTHQLLSTMSDPAFCSSNSAPPTPPRPRPFAVTSASSSATRASSNCRVRTWWLDPHPVRPAVPAGPVRRQVSAHLGPGHRLAAAALHPPPGRSCCSGHCPTCRSASACRSATRRWPTVVREMIASGVERLIVLPMYPQYSATTTASATDVLFHGADERTARAGPAHRAAVLRPSRLPRRHDRGHPRGAGSAAVASPDISCSVFHGIPISYATAGDPYATQSSARRRGLVERLGWPRGTMDADVSVAVSAATTGSSRTPTRR